MKKEEHGVHISVEDKRLKHHKEFCVSLLLRKGPAAFRARLERTNHSLLLLWFSLCDQPFCDPMDSSPPSSSVHGILQAQILE